MPKKTFYHGSRIQGLKVLEPRLDPRLGVVGLFVADEPFGPMMFALLPDRAHSVVKYDTKEGEFIKGKVTTPYPLNEEGWLYTVQPDSKWIRERKTGRYFLIKKTPVRAVRRVTLAEVNRLNWEIEIDQALLKQELGIKTVYEDTDYFIINKPAGVLVHGPGPSLVDWLLEHYPEVEDVGDNPKDRPGIVHRLDRDTSGVLLICRSQKAFDYFKKQFQEHNMRKTYLALVYGVPKEKGGMIDSPIGLKSGSVKRTTHTDKARMVKEAVTHYKVIKVIASEAKQSFALLEVQPVTGRTHQIRVHLSSIGHPIVGDQLYSPKPSAATLDAAHKKDAKAGALDRMFLHAESLEFTSPSGEKIKVAADLPEDLQSFLTNL